MISHPVHLVVASVQRPRFSRLPRQQQPDRQRETYRRGLTPLVDDLFQQVDEHLIPLLPTIVREAGYRADAADAMVLWKPWDDLGHRVRQLKGDQAWWDDPALPLLVRRTVRHDAWSDTLAHALEHIAAAMVRSWPHSRLIALAKRVALVTSKFQRKQLLRQVRHAFGITDLFTREPWLAEREKVWIDQNLRLIKSVPADALDDIHEMVTYGVRRGERAEGIAKMLRERHGVQKRRAERIARDQVGKWYADLNRERQKEMGVEGFIWRSMHDNRVCPICYPLDGQSFTWANPPPDGLPGECHPEDRCYGEPNLQSFWDTLQSGGRIAA